MKRQTDNHRSAGTGTPPDKRPFGGKVVIITGASSGLGSALAQAFSSGGAHLVLYSRNEAELERVAECCREFGTDPLVVKGDVTSPSDCERLVRLTMDRFQRLDILVACAGIGMWARFDELEYPQIMQKVMEVNYLGVVNPLFYALPFLKESAGTLVAVSSIQGKVGVPYHTGYTASKHALQGLCDALRIEMCESGVKVLSVVAHWIRGTQLRKRALGRDGSPLGDQSHPHGSGAVPVDRMAAAILRAIQKKKRTVFVPWWLQMLSWLSELAPSLADQLVARRVRREAGRSDSRSR